MFGIPSFCLTLFITGAFTITSLSFSLTLFATKGTALSTSLSCVLGPSKMAAVELQKLLRQKSVTRNPVFFQIQWMNEDAVTSCERSSDNDSVSFVDRM